MEGVSVQARDFYGERDKYVNVVNNKTLDTPNVQVCMYVQYLSMCAHIYLHTTYLE